MYHRHKPIDLAIVIEFQYMLKVLNRTFVQASSAVSNFPSLIHEAHCPKRHSLMFYHLKR
jgi:hypothetical protein